MRAERLIGFDDTKFRGAPDLAIEILSPSHRAGEVRSRVAEYLLAGGLLVWVIDPRKRIAIAYSTADAPPRIPLHGSLDGEDVLPGLAIPLASIFPT